MAVTANDTVEQFLPDSRPTIRTKGFRSGLEELRPHGKHFCLANPTSLQDCLGDLIPYGERTPIGYGSDANVHVLVHGREHSGQSAPHDHGSCWGGYGQYTHYTYMTRWQQWDDGGNTPGHAALTVQKQLCLDAGAAMAFARGAMHAMAYRVDPCFIRVTDGDGEKQPTLRFNLAQQTVKVEACAQLLR